MNANGGLFWKLEAWWAEFAASQSTEVLSIGIAAVAIIGFFLLRKGIQSALSDEQISFS